MQALPCQTSEPKRRKERIDLLLCERGLAESRHRAQGLILGGLVRVNGQRVDKAGSQVAVDADLSLAGEVLPYVSRGGLKLQRALEGFSLSVTGAVAMDVGASTGGFTDCLLQRGAAKVYAIDVGYGQLAFSLRQDPRVIVIERQNIRSLTAEAIAGPVDLAVIDVSFISLTKVVPKVVSFIKAGGSLITLIKPQFEVGRGEVEKGGVIRTESKRRGVVERICGDAAAWGLSCVGVTPSPILGQKGNEEFLAYFTRKDGI